VQQLLRERVADGAPAVKFGNQTWTWHQHLDEASRHAAAIIAMLDPSRPPHVGTLLGNTPGMLVAMAAAGLGGYVICGINNTRRGSALARDIERSQCQIVLTDSANRSLLEGIRPPGLVVVDVESTEWAERLRLASAFTPLREATPPDTFMLIFTSGTSGEPKAVQVAHMMVPFSGSALVQRFDITAADVLPVDAAVSFQCPAGRLVCRVDVGRCDGARGVLRIPIAARFAAVRRHLHELRWKAVGLRHGY
jgi:fatty-acyl-CoA synthase